MTLAEFISSKLKSFRLQITNEELEVSIEALGGESDSPLTASTMLIAKKVIVSVIPELLLTPDISQGDFSQKFDRNAIMAYYSFLCEEIGEENKLSRQPRIYDASNRW